MSTKKMSQDVFMSLFPPYEPGRYKPRKATQKGFEHKHRTTYKPPKADQTPAQWMHEQRARKNKKAVRKLTHQCPACEKSMKKLDFCMTDKRWSVKKAK